MYQLYVYCLITYSKLYTTDSSKKTNLKLMTIEHAIGIY